MAATARITGTVSFRETRTVISRKDGTEYKFPYVRVMDSRAGSMADVDINDDNPVKEGDAVDWLVEVGAFNSNVQFKAIKPYSGLTTPAPPK